MFGLPTGIAVLFIICILAVCIFEFANGFHDTANAVATVIYTGSLKPTYAVVWSGLWNFIGLFLSSFWGYKVAMGIVNLLPLSDMITITLNESVSLVLGMLISGIVWNLGTWYLGIPCSSSHTLIGSILGVGVVFSLLHTSSTGVNWGKAGDIGLSLLVSPLFGFSVTILLMYILRRMLKVNKQIFKEPEPGSRPPMWIRGILITTCTLVSFFHGNNDGQKGIGLMLIILITFMPMKFALNESFDSEGTISTLHKLENLFEQEHKKDLVIGVHKVENAILDYNSKKVLDEESLEKKKSLVAVRVEITKLNKTLGSQLKNQDFLVNNPNRELVKESIDILRKDIEFSPRWVTIMIALCLGLGTMIGWKRIAVTIGEKIGKRHMTYAEGATAELTAAATIGLSSGFGLPVSTTHVLSSGVAGAMTASKGVKNLQPDTIKSIAIAWILTLPVTMVMAGGVYYLLNLILN